jgi:hypothetical protein
VKIQVRVGSLLPFNCLAKLVPSNLILVGKGAPAISAKVGIKSEASIKFLETTP